MLEACIAPSGLDQQNHSYEKAKDHCSNIVGSLPTSSCIFYGISCGSENSINHAGQSTFGLDDSMYSRAFKGAVIILEFFRTFCPAKLG